MDALLRPLTLWRLPYTLARLPDRPRASDACVSVSNGSWGMSTCVQQAQGRRRPLSGHNQRAQDGPACASALGAHTMSQAGLAALESTVVRRRRSTFRALKSRPGGMTLIMGKWRPLRWRCRTTRSRAGS